MLLPASASPAARFRAPRSRIVAAIVRHGGWRFRGVSVALGLTLVPLLFVMPLSLSAQEGGGACDVPRHEGFTSLMLSNGTRVLYFSRPTMRCPGGTRIDADSAVVYESTRYNQLFGNVVFVEGDSRLRADEAQYFEREGRLVAWGNAVLTDGAEGSVIRGDTMVFLRAGDMRAEDRLTVTGRRPHATLYPSRRPPPDLPPDTLPPGAGATVADTLAPPPGAVAEPPVPDSMVLPTGVAAEPPVPDSLALQRAQEAGLPPAVDTLSPAPAEPGERVPYEVHAQRIVLEGSRYFRATGSVEITRDSLEAVAEEVELDQEAGGLTLTNAARVRTSNTDLAADSIRLDIPEDEIRQVYARSNAILEGEDVRILAPIIFLFLAEGSVDRLVAVRDASADSLLEAREGQDPGAAAGGPPRPLPEAARELGLTEFPSKPLALAEDFRLTADSIEVLTPGEVLDQVWAMGGARGESTGRDSLNTPDTPPIVALDWLEGDTIVATFAKKGSTPNAVLDSVAGAGRAPLAVADTLGPEEDPVPFPETPGTQPDSAEAGYRLERLEARVAARSLYRMEPSDSTAMAEGLLAVHYVIGDQIVINFSQGEIERMEVENARGMHMEPVARQRRVGEPVGGTSPPGAGGGVGR